MSEVKFPNRVLQRFVETVSVELGAGQFNAMLSLSSISVDWAKHKFSEYLNFAFHADPY